MTFRQARKIIDEVADEYGLHIADILGESRTKTRVKARCCTAHRIRTETELSLPEIGEVLGERDHTAVLNLLRRHKKLCGENTRN